MKLQVNRKTWSRGKGLGYLLDNDGKMCIFGFYMLALGIPETSLLNEIGFTSIAKNYPELIPSWVYTDRHIVDCLKVISINDRKKQDRREQELTLIFARNGVELEFV